MRYYRCIKLETLLKLHTDSTPALNTVTSYGDDYIEVSHVRFSHAVAFGPTGKVTEWPVQATADITLALLRQAAGLPATAQDPVAFLDEGENAPLPRPANAPEVLLVGTGKHQKFLSAELVQPMWAQGVGVEVIDTRAAARTYNILVAEGRRVVAALMVPNGDSQ
jgi:uncharacterized protein